MTEKQAIEVIKKLVFCGSCTTGPCGDCERKLAKDTAILAMEEIQQYRSIGTMEEIQRMRRYAALAKRHDTIGKVIDECAEYESIGTVEECREAIDKQERMTHYENLLEQGRLLELPCEIGQRVYEIYRFLGEGAWEIEEHVIRLEDLNKIGKTVFLVRQEAEEAIDRIKSKQER